MVNTVQEYKHNLKNRNLRIREPDIFFTLLEMQNFQMYLVEIFRNVPVFPLVTTKIFQVSISGQNHPIRPPLVVAESHGPFVAFPGVSISTPG